ncbi:MAG TPA: PEP-CTERM sorting domain-containing protein, partial [Thermoguttaceae bacterium]|nr:PEP-CTERM sorting domain-containing protein [Thermoguttaceae bacterium]
SAVDVTVDADSTLRSDSAGLLAFDQLILNNGTVTVSGSGPVSFSGFSINPAATAVGIDAQVPVELQSSGGPMHLPLHDGLTVTLGGQPFVFDTSAIAPLGGGSATVGLTTHSDVTIDSMDGGANPTTLVKAGGGLLELGTMQNFGQLTFEIQGGSVAGILKPGSPLIDPTTQFSFAGGGLAFATEAAAPEQTFGLPLNLAGDGSFVVKTFGTGADGGVVNIGSDTAGINLNNKAVATFKAENDYTLNVRAAITGNGSVEFLGGNVNLQANAPMEYDGHTVVRGGVATVNVPIDATTGLRVLGGKMVINSDVIVNRADILGALDMGGFMNGGVDDTLMDFSNGGGLMAQAPVGTTVFTGNFDINGDGVFRGLIPEITRNDNYQTLFTGMFNATVSGDYYLQFANKDDRVVMYLDLDQDGVFQSGERMLGLGNGNRTQYIDAGEYAVAFGHMEGGGGSRIRFLMTTPAGGPIPTNSVLNLGNAAHAELFYVPRPPITLVDNAELEVNGMLDGGNLTVTNGVLRVGPDGLVLVDTATFDQASTADVEGSLVVTESMIYSRGPGKDAVYTIGDGTATFQGADVTTAPETITLNGTLGIATTGLVPKEFGAQGFQLADINSGNVAGDVTPGFEDSYTITGSGADIWGGGDGMAYLYDEFDAAGPMELVAYVGVNGFNGGTNAWRKAGVMVRQSLANNSRNGITLIAEGDGNGINMQIRRSDGAGSDGATGTGPRTNHDTPAWLKIAYAGDGVTFDSFWSDDPVGAGWNHIGTNTLNDPLSGLVTMGLAVTSHNTGETTTVQFDNVSGSGNLVAPSPVRMLNTDVVVESDSVMDLGGFSGEFRSLSVAANTAVTLGPFDLGVGNVSPYTFTNVTGGDGSTITGDVTIAGAVHAGRAAALWGPTAAVNPMLYNGQAADIGTTTFVGATQLAPSATTVLEVLGTQADKIAVREGAGADTQLILGGKVQFRGIGVEWNTVESTEMAWHVDPATGRYVYGEVTTYRNVPYYPGDPGADPPIPADPNPMTLTLMEVVDPDPADGMPAMGEILGRFDRMDLAGNPNFNSKGGLQIGKGIFASDARTVLDETRIIFDETQTNMAYIELGKEFWETVITPNPDFPPTPPPIIVTRTYIGDVPEELQGLRFYPVDPTDYDLSDGLLPMVTDANGVTYHLKDDTLRYTVAAFNGIHPTSVPELGDVEIYGKVTGDFFYALSGDVNGDGNVDGSDVLPFINNWTGNNLNLPADKLWTQGDVAEGPYDRGDGKVNLLDLTKFMNNFGKADPGAPQDATAVAVYDPTTGEITVAVDDVMLWMLYTDDRNLDGSGVAGVEALIPADEYTLVSATPDVVGAASLGDLQSYALALGQMVEPGTDPADIRFEYMTGFGGDRIQGTIKVVPEPGTIALLASGLLGLALLVWRRRRRVG